MIKILPAVNLSDLTTISQFSDSIFIAVTYGYATELILGCFTLLGFGGGLA